MQNYEQFNVILSQFPINRSCLEHRRRKRTYPFDMPGMTATAPSDASFRGNGRSSTHEIEKPMVERICHRIRCDGYVPTGPSAKFRHHADRKRIDSFHRHRWGTTRYRDSGCPVPVISFPGQRSGERHLQARIARGREPQQRTGTWRASRRGAQQGGFPVRTGQLPEICPAADIQS